MSSALISKETARHRRHRRVRRKILGTAQRPRLSIFRSHQHMSAQLIDDVAGRTLVSAATQEAVLRKQTPKGGGLSAAKAVGRLIAERAKAVKIDKVVYDRSGYQYHGRVKSLADGAREGGLEF